MLASNTVLQNRYLIVRQIVQGGMGAVYFAKDQRLDSTVALKQSLFSDSELRCRLNVSPETARRIFKEVQAEVSSRQPILIANEPLVKTPQVIAETVAYQASLPRELTLRNKVVSMASSPDGLVILLG
ncbi:MAG: hypothetical protein AB1489_31850 [Acidobacteriota bacterium]